MHAHTWAHVSTCEHMPKVMPMCALLLLCKCTCMHMDTHVCRLGVFVCVCTKMCLCASLQVCGCVAVHRQECCLLSLPTRLSLCVPQPGAAPDVVPTFLIHCRKIKQTNEKLTPLLARDAPKRLKLPPASPAGADGGSSRAHLGPWHQHR